MKININSNIQDIVINIDDGISLGTIINELLTNSIKHNSDKDNLNIDITLFKNRNTIYLDIKDNGKGFQISDKKGLGLKLVNQFSKKLKNQESNFSFENGTKFQLKFDNKA